MDNLNVVYESRRNIRFVVIKGEWCSGDSYLNVYDKQDYMVVGYYECDDLITAREVCDYLNSLNDELTATDKELSDYKSLVDTGKGELFERIRSLEYELASVRNHKCIELKFYRDTLDECLGAYPDSKGLWDFKSSVGW